MLTKTDASYIPFVNDLVSPCGRCVSGGGVFFTETATAQIYTDKYGLQLLHAPSARYPWLARP